MNSAEVSRVRYHFNDAPLSPIRARTRNAIAQHRALRNPDQRRTYVGTSGSVFHRPKPLEPIEHAESPGAGNGIYAGGSIPDAVALSIYEDIESSEQQIKQMPKQPEDIAGDPNNVSLSTSLEGHLQQMESMFLSPSVGSTVPTALKPTYQYRREDDEIYKTSYREEAELPSQDGYQHRTESVVGSRSPQAQQVVSSSPIVFRDDESSYTGMSQQELIRKKARSIRRKRLSSKPRKPFVQLPPQLLMGSRISAPQRQFYHTIERPTSVEMSKRYLWNKLQSTAKDRENSPDREMSSATAEMTNESGESMHQLGSFAAAIAAPTSPTRRQPVLAVRGDDALIWMDPIDQQSLGDESFPVASQVVVDRNFENEGVEVFARRHTPLSSQVRRNDEVPLSRTHVDTTPAKLKCGNVRFADTFSAHVDDESSMPWDQKTDLKGSAHSPASVLENVDELDDTFRPTTAMPKSILRRSRYKPTPLPKSKPVKDFGIYDTYDEPERLLYALTTSSRLPVSHCRGIVDESSKADFACRPQSHRPPSDVLQTQEPRKPPLESATQMSRSLSPPRNTIGLLDTDGLELSPIRPNSERVDVGVERNFPELELRKKMATFLAMRDGEIADRVMEEEGYPDPPLEIDMDDDETVLSAYVFIETVAAIVIQTAIRQFLAVLHAYSLRETREAMAIAERVISIEESCLEDSLIASSKGNTSLESSEEYLYARLVDDDLDRVALDLYDLAAIQIQATYRGFWVRDCLDVDHYCATVIQRMYRGLACRRKFAHDVRRIVIVQSIFRRNIARDRAADMLTYVIIIQATFRGYLVKRRYDAYRKKVARIKFRAATTIQSRWRAFVCEAYFIRTLVDVLIVQTVVRKWLAKRRRDLVLKEKLRFSGQMRSASQKPPYQGASRSVNSTTLIVNPTEVEVQGFDASKRRIDPHGIVIIDPRNVSGSSTYPPSMEGSKLSDTKWTTAAARCLTSDSKKLYVKSSVVAYPDGDATDSFDGKSARVHRNAETGGDLRNVKSATRIAQQDDEESPHDSQIPPQRTSTLVSIWKEKERQNGYVPRNT